jgi:hypothetical protein
MVVATKTRIYVGQLPPYQKSVMLAARTLSEGGTAVTPTALAEEIEGDTNQGTILKINTAIAALTNKGCWMFNKAGKPLPGDFGYIGWPDGTAAPTAATRTASGRTTTGSEADRQTEREFVHTIQAGYAELPFETQVRVKDAVRTLEDLVMKAQR